MDNALYSVSDEERTVLIISAHGHLRSHYCEVLKGLEVNTFAVGDGFEALVFLRSYPVHAIFADFFLPGINALELHLLIKELHFQIPLVICSNDLTAKRRNEALKIGVSNIVRKPTHNREIVRSVQEAIEARESRMLQFFC